MQTIETTRHHIRWLLQRDMPEVVRIERLAGGLGWDEGKIRAPLRDRSCIGMIAESHRDADIVKGFYIYELLPHKFQLLNLAVHPEWQRSLIATTMIDRLKSKLSVARRRCIIADVPEDKLSMQLFLRSQGFRAVSAKDGAYRFTFEF